MISVDISRLVQKYRCIFFCISITLILCPNLSSELPFQENK